MRFYLSLCALALVSGCTVTSSSGMAQPAVWLTFGQSEIVRIDEVEHYRCSEGLLVSEYFSGRTRRISCGDGMTPALMR